MRCAATRGAGSVRATPRWPKPMCRSFPPGEAYQFDWSHEVVVLAGMTTVVKVAHVRLCYSRMPFVRAYPRESAGDGVRRP